MKTQIIRAGALPIALATLVAAMPAAALDGKPTVPGAMPNDKNMTCQDIATERTAINHAVLAGVAKNEQAKKTKKRLFGFAKSLATIAVPGAGLLASGSPFGSMAAQQASQAALDAVGNGGAQPAAAPAPAKPSDEQQARLTRLDSIAAFRQCAA